MLAMNTPLFDTHCHFDFSEFDDSRDGLWQQCLQVGVQHLLIPGVEPCQWSQAEELTNQYVGIVMAAGLHPWWVASHQVPDDELWERQLNHSNCVAIGECGLDAHIETPLDSQLSVFEKHLQMAVDVSMPVVIHVRKTHNETIRMLKKYRPASGGVIHGFTGSVELAEEYWALGFRLGIGGSITYSRANKTREAVTRMPLESLLLETDAPDMPLQGYQGQSNSPLRLTEVAKTLSELRNESLETVAKVTTTNAQTLFFNL